MRQCDGREAVREAVREAAVTRPVVPPTQSEHESSTAPPAIPRPAGHTVRPAGSAPVGSRQTPSRRRALAYSCSRDLNRDCSCKHRTESVGSQLQ